MTLTTFTFSNSPFTETTADTVLTRASYNNRTNELTSVVIGTMVTALGHNCFYNCQYLTNATISNTVVTIGDNCFSRTKISSIVIPSSVTSIGEACFSTCYDLNSAEISNSVTILRDTCFYNCILLQEINIPDSVESIGNYCFSDCLRVTSIIIPSSVITLGTNCFNNLTALTTVTIPESVTTLGNFCFNNCTNLETVNLSNTVTSLGEFCFANCNALTSIIIPSFVTSLGSYCFLNCDLITELQFNNQINLTSIGLNIFANISNGFNVSYYNTSSYNNLTTLSKALQTQMPSGISFVYIPTPAPPCFNKGTKILIFDFTQSVETYLSIEQLKVGDLVKTYRHGYIPIKHIGSSIIVNNPQSKLESMFKHKKTNLIVTGGHSLLADSITQTQQNSMKKIWNFSRRIENKYCLLACVSSHFTQIMDNNEYEIYHLVLDSKILHFGIYAENTLTESCSAKAFETFFYNNVQKKELKQSKN